MSSSSNVPIKLEELFKLTSLGIHQSFISFNNVTLESDKYICVKEQVDGNSSIAIIDVATKKVTRNRMNADSAIMNPNTRVLALRAGNQLQIFNLDMKSKVKSTTMSDGVSFWKWISASTLALVTPKSVYHWSMQGDAEPKKVYDRLPDMADAQIINYRGDAGEKWFCIVGLAKQADGSMKGLLQLHSMEKNASQLIEGHAACFGLYRHPGTNHTSNVVCFAANKADGGKLFIMEVPTSARDPNAPTFNKVIQNVNFTNSQDFPVAMQISDKYGIVYLICRSGFLYMFDIASGTLIYGNKITQDTIFTSAFHSESNGIVGINRSGQVLLVTVNEDTIVSYLSETLSSFDLALKIAIRADLGGADELFISQFDRQLQSGNLQEAIKLAAHSPRGILRTPQSIGKLGRIPAPPGQQPPLLQYFKFLLSEGKLNAYESVELSKLALQKQGGVNYVKNLVEEGKIEGSEELGDLLKQYDSELALKIYARGNAPSKVIQSFMEQGQFDKIFAYCERANYSPDWSSLLANLISINPDAAVNFATELATKGHIDVASTTEVFVQRNLIPQVTAFLLDVLRENREEDAALQTRLLEINLLYSPPKVADQILGNDMFSHYDRKKIAALCERAQLYQRALENFEDINDIKRVIVNTHMIDPNWLLNFFGTMEEDDCLECLKVLLDRNFRQNLQIVVQVATKYSDELTPARVIELFESFKSNEGLFYYLNGIVNFSQDPDVHFKYIQAATRLGQISEVERITRESQVYNGEKVFDFLKDAKLQDLWPLINVADRFDFIGDMVSYLYISNQLKYVELYVQQRAPPKTPLVIGALIDVDANEDYIKNLLLNVGNVCPVEPLVEEVEKRNRLKIILPWLEARAKENNEEPSLHNALAKIYIDMNRNPEEFLKTNPFYDSRVVGKYCEKRDPMLAFLAFQRGQCDQELLELTTKNSMFRQQARYLVERQDEDLWEQVLAEDTPNRRALIDQVVQTALPDSTNPDEVSTTVKAFMVAELPNELIELLEKIVLHGNSDFKTNKNLQNLLILTAIKADKGKVMGYVETLDNYDGQDIAKIARSAELYEEAFFIYKKFDLHLLAVEVLTGEIQDMERAQEYADRVQTPEVWSQLANAQLDASLVSEAIDNFMKADDASDYNKVIQAVESVNDFYTDLIKYLRMARKKVKDANLDTSLVYAYAKTDKLAELEDFISASNLAKISQVGEKCFSEKLYQAAKILFRSISAYGRLASTLVKLGQFQQAVDEARKANSVRTWKEVCFACVDAKEFRLAHIAGLNIIVQADHMEEVTRYYEQRGHFEEVIQLMETGISLERAHNAMFTELAILYARYMSDKLMEHVRIHHKRINTSRLIRICEENCHWSVLRFLYSSVDEHDNAVKTMMVHPSAFDNKVFKDEIIRVRNNELYYRAIGFYLDEHPSMLVDMLSALAPKVDHSRVVSEVKRVGDLALIKPYLQNVQDVNNSAVNEALNHLYVEEEDFDSLRHSIEMYDKFDHMRLAQVCEKHELIEMRRVSAYVFKKIGKFRQSVELSKKDKMYKDVMETAADSNDVELAEEVLQFFVEIGQKECFAACLFTCYDLIRPDVAMEVAWRNNIMDFAMPYLVQTLREYTEKVDTIIAERKAEKEAEPTPEEAAKEQTVLPGVMPQMTGVPEIPYQYTGMTPLPFMNTGDYGYGYQQ